MASTSSSASARVAVPLPWLPYCLAYLRPELQQPTLDSAVLPRLRGITSPTPLWKPPEGFLPSFEAAACLYHFLEQMALVLDEASATCKMWGSSPINPFLNPISTLGGCMVYDRQRGERWPKGVMREGMREGEKARYMRVELGSDEAGGRAIEGAHRMVLYATCGPPFRSSPEVLEASELRCIHIGCDNQACLNPLHLAWGSASENNIRVDRYEQDPAALEADQLRVAAAKGRVRDRRGQHLREAGLVEMDWQWVTLASEVYQDYHRRARK